MGINGCDSIRVDKNDAKLAVVKSGNLAMGRDQYGDAITGPMFTSMDGGMMLACALPTFWSRKGEIFKPYQWYNSAGQLENVSRTRYFANNFKSQFRSWTNFNNSNWVTDKIQLLEGYAKKSGKVGRQYGQVLKEFQAAQKSMQMTGQLQSGMTFEKLSKSFADVRLADNTAILKKGSKAGTWAKTCARSSRWIKKGMAASKGLRTFSRVTGKVGGPVAIIATCLTLGLDIFTAAAAAKPGEGWKDAGRQLVKSGLRAGAELGGAWGGMKLGAAIGGCLGPVGAIVGGLVGSIAGWAFGSWVANQSDFINTSVVEENQMKDWNIQKQTILEAIEKGDLETLAQFLSGSYQYKVDEKGQPIPDAEGNIQPEVMTDAAGQPILDENGNPRLKIVQISENADIQKQYEALVGTVEKYLTQEATAQQKRAEAEAQAEAERQAELAKYANIGYGCGVLSPEYQADYAGYGAGSGYTYGGYTPQTMLANAGNYSDFSYSSPAFLNYNSNIFATKYGPQAE